MCTVYESVELMIKKLISFNFNTYQQTPTRHILKYWIQETSHVAPDTTQESPHPVINTKIFSDLIHKH